MKRDNTAKTWIVRWQFRGGQMFLERNVAGTAPGALPPYLFHDSNF